MDIGNVIAAVVVLGVLGAVFMLYVRTSVQLVRW